MEGTVGRNSSGIIELRMYTVCGIDTGGPHG
jgi:hypothetical protein